MPTLNKLTATINAGTPLSNVVDVADNFVVGIIMPDAWTAAHVTLMLSLDSTNFYDLFSFRGEASTGPIEFKFNVVPDAIVAVNSETMLMARYIRFRSGTRNEPIPQAAARVFSLITVNRVTAQAKPAEGEL